MNLNPILNSLRSKGSVNFFRRIGSITQHYGVTASAMDLALQQFTELLRQYNFTATFPITAVTLGRYANTLTKYYNPTIEFAVHGYTHIDYSLFGKDELSTHLLQARKIFYKEGITPDGFRSPYLSQNKFLHENSSELGFKYASNQPYLWDVIGPEAITKQTMAGFENVLSYYSPWRSTSRPSIPRFVNNIIELPVSLPDDEILIDRLHASSKLILATWCKMLQQSYRRGELLTLQLHPERFVLFADSLRTFFTYVQSFSPKVWCANLRDITSWWETLNKAKVKFSSSDNGQCHFFIDAPDSVTILARGIEVQAAVKPSSNGFIEVNTKGFSIYSPKRPIIGVSPRTSIKLIDFLRNQGYILESSQNSPLYSYYFDIDQFEDRQENSILESIENSKHPLVKLGRWPNGCQSALAITGDIDAMTFWDYGLRLLGK
jgi:hypothetical protein